LDDRAEGQRASPPGELLPYEETLSVAARERRILHRDNIYGSGPPTTVPSPECLSLVAAHSGSSVLDVGCGLGVYLAALQERGITAVGLEINPDYVATAQSLNRDVRLYDGASIPFPDCAFDTVMALEVLEHIPQWETTLHEMLRVARRCVLISVPNIGVIPHMYRHLVVPWHLLEATHVNFFTREILAAYLSRIPNISSDITSYGPFQINGETYHNHLFAVIYKTPAERGAASPVIASSSGENAD
jgi:SAM-dependent methyltransferase